MAGLAPRRAPPRGRPAYRRTETRLTDRAAAVPGPRPARASPSRPTRRLQVKLSEHLPRQHPYLLAPAAEHSLRPERRLVPRPFGVTFHPQLADARDQFGKAQAA